MYGAEPFLRRCHLCSHSGNSQQAEIPLPREKEKLRFGSNMVMTLQGKAKKIASRGSRAQLIPGLKGKVSPVFN
jgi:hypothetical protein